MRHTSNLLPADSPVEALRKTLPRGDGNWPGFAKVWQNIQKGCFAMAQDPHVHLSDEHVHAMAVLGSGDETLMKYEQMRMRDRGWL